MAADQSQLEAAVRAVVDPELGLSLGDLGLLRTARTRRRRVMLEVVLPVASPDVVLVVVFVTLVLRE